MIKMNEETRLTETGINSKKRGGLSRCCVNLLVVLLLALLALSIAGIYYIVQYSNVNRVLGSSENAPASCLEIKGLGQFPSNYYLIRPVPGGKAFMTYCDMETDGGGWTLVASIHEGNIDEKCASDDVWYSNGTNEGSTSLWENTETLNSADGSTDDDYKNAAYFGLKASDVLIRHVPNRSPVSESKSTATLEYRSDDKFLEEYGGNLQSVFAHNFSLTPVEDTAEVFGPSVLEDMLDALVDKADAGGILNTTTPPPFYQYEYDDASPSRLTNGGNNLFDPYGMQISVKAPNCTDFDLNYGQTYTCADLSSRKSYPFFALTKTMNNTQPKSYAYTVTSLRTNGDDRSFQGSSNSVLGINNVTMNYYFSCKYSDTVPSYCDIWFTVKSEDRWGSTSVYPDIEYPYIDATASHGNAVYGYTMVAREPPSFTRTEIPIQNIMRGILEVLARFETIDIQSMLDALVAEGSGLLDFTIPPYYRYKYDDVTPYRLTTNGENNLFNPYGMEVELQVRETASSVRLNYGESYTLKEEVVQISSRKSYPFFALANTENTDHVIGYKFTEGRSRDDVASSSSSDSDDLVIGNYKMTYSSACRYSNSTPGLCDVVFEVFNTKDWNSVELTPTRYSISTFLIKNISGVEYDFPENTFFTRHTNAIVGYTFIAREPGSPYIQMQIPDILYNMLEVFARYPSIGFACSTPSNNLVVPVKYITGNEETVTDGVPPKLRPLVTPDFMQFRAVANNGNVYAFCPAIKVGTCQSKFLCVGGVSSNQEKSDDCSDYLDWADAENRSSYSLPEEAREKMHSRRDVQSTIMIFYR